MVPKFRAWDEEEKRWINIASLVFDEGGELWYLSPVMDDFNPVYYENELGKTWEIMQSTGLKDKNGVDIFEGDVLNIIEVTDQGLKEYLTDVKWEDCSFVVKSGGDDYDTFLAAWTSDPNTTYPLFEIQVVGNIYENPELMEQANE
ncbi:YopX family protein [Enterococcus gallinarum]|uniref:YopX family protein n=1 Tax=Enterococcus gallinarum TaxID=1353 RepID=UPI0032E3EC98